jgi:lipopolysaccharide transport system permease protein
MKHTGVPVPRLVDAISAEIGQTRPTTVIQPTVGLFRLDLKALWPYREMLYFLVLREVKVRYKQTAIGAAWAIFQPLMTMLIFALIFGRFAKIPSDGLPYPVFAYTALLPWNYFSQAISRSGTSLVSDANLIRKVYFPRLIIPTAGVISPVVDFVLSLFLLFGMMAWYGIMPTWNAVTLPIFFCLAVCTALAVSLWLSALNVRYRDVGHTIPFLVQIGMYASPIAYPVSLVPERWRSIYSLNPMAGVIEAFRWGLLGKGSPDFRAMAISAVVVLVLLISGLVFFKRLERTFADVV